MLVTDAKRRGAGDRRRFDDHEEEAGDLRMMRGARTRPELALCMTGRKLHYLCFDLRGEVIFQPLPDLMRVNAAVVKGLLIEAKSHDLRRASSAYRETLPRPLLFLSHSYHVVHTPLQFAQPLRHPTAASLPLQRKSETAPLPRPLASQPPPYTVAITASSTAAATTDDAATSALTCTSIDNRVSSPAIWVPETLPNRVLYKLNAPPKSDVPIIEPEMPNGANGLIFGFPMRFRMMAAQFMDFLDKTGPL
nr:uncharacterized protein LOC114925623 [Arachis hypogaea]